MADSTLAVNNPSMYSSNTVKNIMKGFLNGDTSYTPPQSSPTFKENFSGTDSENQNDSATPTAVADILRRIASESETDSSVSTPALDMSSIKAENCSNVLNNTLSRDEKPSDFESSSYSSQFQSMHEEHVGDTGKQTDISSLLYPEKFDHLKSDQTRTNLSQISSIGNVDYLGYGAKPAKKGIRNVEEIMQEYSSPSLSTRSSRSTTSSNPQAFVKTDAAGNVIKSGRMNISQNNETLGSPEVDEEQVTLRRKGSSVDADATDFGRSFINTKPSYSNVGLTRSRTSMASLGSHTYDSAEEKESTMPVRIPSESEVDNVKPHLSFVRQEQKEIRIDMSRLNLSFVKERERLRHIETLIRKTPSSNYSNDYQPWKQSYGYQSKFMYDMNSASDYLGSRRAMSSTDYDSMSKWRPKSLDRTSDYVNRTPSNPSYGQTGQFSPTHESRPSRRDHNVEFQSSEVDGDTYMRGRDNSRSSSSPPYKSPNKYSPQAERYMTDYQTGNHLDGKKNKNMSKTLVDSKPTGKKKASVKPRKSKSSVYEATRQREKSQANLNSSQNFSKKHSQRSKQGQQVPGLSASLINSIIREVAKCSNESDMPIPDKYLPYQPASDSPIRSAHGRPMSAMSYQGRPLRDKQYSNNYEAYLSDHLNKTFDLESSEQANVPQQNIQYETIEEEPVQENDFHKEKNRKNAGCIRYDPFCQSEVVNPLQTDSHTDQTDTSAMDTYSLQSKSKRKTVKTKAKKTSSTGSKIKRKMTKKSS